MAFIIVKISRGNVMANDNRDDQATAEEIQRVVFGKGYENLLGRWVRGPISRMPMLIQNVSFGQAFDGGFSGEVALMPLDKLAATINIKDEMDQEDIFRELDPIREIKAVSATYIDVSILGHDTDRLYFCGTPKGFSRVSLSPELRAYLAAGVLGTERRRTDADRLPHIITSVGLGSFDGERFSLSLICAESDKGEVYDISSGQYVTKRDPGAPKRAPGRVSPFRRPSQDR